MKNPYLIGGIIVLLLVSIPFFQNSVQQGGRLCIGMNLFRMTLPFSNGYRFIIFLGMILGAIAVLATQNFIKSIKTKNQKGSFDLT
jgi:hypothetical protein